MAVKMVRKYRGRPRQLLRKAIHTLDQIVNEHVRHGDERAILTAAQIVALLSPLGDTLVPKLTQTVQRNA